MACIEFCGSVHTTWIHQCRWALQPFYRSLFLLVCTDLYFSDCAVGVRDRMKFDLYLWMFPTFLEHTSLAIVDMTPLYQSQWTVMELQVFLFTLRLFSKLGHKICNQKLSRMYKYCSLYDRSFYFYGRVR